MKNTRHLALILLLAGNDQFAIAAENDVLPQVTAQSLSEDDYIGGSAACAYRFKTLTIICRCAFGGDRDRS